MDGLHCGSPLISIILPVYNGEKYLAKSIESCLNQTYKNLEIIIVNDASTDSSGEIADSYAIRDKRIRILSNMHNLNLPASLNVGHKTAKGEFMTWTSDDNLYSPDALEVLYDEIINQKADIIFSDFDIINEKAETIGNYEFKNDHSILLENFVRASFLYKKEIFLKNKGYNEELFKIEDYDFWLSASRYAVIRHVNRKLYFYRRHSASLTSQKTISQFRFQQEYVEKVKEMYRLFFTSFSIKHPREIAELFCALHLQQKIDVVHFCENFFRYKKDLTAVLKKYGDKKILKDIDIRIRYNIQRYPDNQNFQTIFKILINRPSILLLYSKRRTLKILYLVIKRSRI